MPRESLDIRSERPRERIRRVGTSALDDSDLLAAMLGTGAQRRSVMRVAADLLRSIDACHGEPTLDDLLSVPGIGEAKACAVLAALEFSRRRFRPNGMKIRDVDDVLKEVHYLSQRKQEHFICISLNGAHEVIKTRIVSVGLVNMTQVHPREVFADPIIDRACAVVLAHNHPSGDCTPSIADRETTKRLQEAGILLGIKLLDHVIFSSRGHFSFQSVGLL
jgi:DNA repair protein RadC